MSYLVDEIKYIKNEKCSAKFYIDLVDRIKNKEQIIKTLNEVDFENEILFTSKGVSKIIKYSINKCFCQDCVNQKHLIDFLSTYQDSNKIKSMISKIKKRSQMTLVVDNNSTDIFYENYQKNDVSKKLKGTPGEYLYEKPTIVNLDKTEDVRIIRLKDNTQLEKYLKAWFSLKKNNNIVNKILEILNVYWCKRTVSISRKNKKPQFLNFKYVCNCPDIDEKMNPNNILNIKVGSIGKKLIELFNLLKYDTTNLMKFLGRHNESKLVFISFNNDLKDFKIKINYTDKWNKVSDVENFIYNLGMTHIVLPYPVKKLKSYSLNLSRLLKDTFKLFKVSDKFVTVFNNLTLIRSNYHNSWRINYDNKKLSYDINCHTDPSVYKDDINYTLSVVNDNIKVRQELTNIKKPMDIYSFKLGNQISTIRTINFTSEKGGELGIYDGNEIKQIGIFNLYFSKKVKNSKVHFENINEFLEKENLTKYQKKIFIFKMPRFSITINKFFDGNYEIIYSGLKIEKFISFLKEFKYPKVLLEYIKKNTDKYSHLYFDVGFKFKILNQKVTYTGSSFYGNF